MYKQKTWQEMSRFAKRWVGSPHLGITCQFHEINCWSSRLEQSLCSLKAFVAHDSALIPSHARVCLCMQCMLARAKLRVCALGMHIFFFLPGSPTRGNTRCRRTKLFRGPMQYWCAWGLSASTASRGQGLARGCPPRLWFLFLPLQQKSRNQ